MRSGGGLFTRSGSAADPLFVERLPAIATITITMIDEIRHDGCRLLSKKRRFEPLVVLHICPGTFVVYYMPVTCVETSLLNRAMFLCYTARKE